MASVSQVECSLKHILEERANVLARETGCIERQRKFSGADLLQTLVFGWLSHPEASLEALASVATLREVEVTDTAVHKRFTPACAPFLHAILGEMTSVVVEAGRGRAPGLLKPFKAGGPANHTDLARPNGPGSSLHALWGWPWARSPPRNS